MALTPNFSTSQTVGESSKITFTDTSTGSDGSIASRRIYLQTATGVYLVESGTPTDYEVWVYADSTITLDLLDKDYALNVLVQWLDSGGTVLYSKQLLLGFTLYNNTFNYGLTQMLTANPNNFNSKAFFQNKIALTVEMDSGDQALELASDIFGAQRCYDRATQIRLNSQYLLNIN